MVRDGSIRDVPRIGRGLASLFGRHGLLTGSLPAVLAYFRRDFHPNDDDLSSLEREWRRELGLH